MVPRIKEDLGPIQYMCGGCGKSMVEEESLCLDCIDDIENTGATWDESQNT